ncbi:hypothetical protein [Saccharopolyspora hordei]|uniref:Putative outer membrane lipoprotein n=1 Tax=Saccharopolyspora hordei TaxID=1838 RepID=A0A853ART3_9PSEU|nr:hypothetical protein [Saccharopolyspora hordei]NYI84281.1 putative outer membrane lipoprotein [Saccharopolyspora hordei]
MSGHVLRGLLAGAAGTTALNATTYLDMAVRGRPASQTPEQTVQEFEKRLGTTVSSDEAIAANRRSGIGALLGIAAGLGSGVLYGLVRARWDDAPVTALAIGAGVAANLIGTVPMVALGVTDPREWPASSWLMDVVPHLAFGVATAVTYEQMGRRTTGLAAALDRALRHARAQRCCHRW